MKEEIKEYLRLKTAASLTEDEQERLKELQARLYEMKDFFEKRKSRKKLNRNEKKCLEYLEAALKGETHKPRQTTAKSITNIFKRIRRRLFPPAATTKTEAEIEPPLAEDWEDQKPPGPEKVTQIVKDDKKTILEKIEEYGCLSARLEKGEKLKSEEKIRFAELENELIPLWNELKRKIKKGEELTHQEEEQVKAFEFEDPKEKEERPNKKCLIPWFIAGIFFILAILLGANWYLTSVKKAKLASELASVKAKLAAAEAMVKEMEEAKANSEAKLEFKATTAKTTEDVRLESAMVREKGGIETVIINQLKNDSQLTKGVKVTVKGRVYDLTDRSIEDTADLLARNFGIVSGKKEVRVRFASKVSYLLEREGDGMVMKVYEKETDGTFKLIYSLKTSAEKEGSFRGEKLQNFEYPYTYSSTHASQAGLPVLFSIQDLF